MKRNKVNPAFSRKRACIQAGMGERKGLTHLSLIAAAMALNEEEG